MTEPEAGGKRDLDEEIATLRRAVEEELKGAVAVEPPRTRASVGPPTKPRPSASFSSAFRTLYAGISRTWKVVWIYAAAAVSIALGYLVVYLAGRR